MPESGRPTGRSSELALLAIVSALLLAMLWLAVRAPERSGVGWSLLGAAGVLLFAALRSAPQRARLRGLSRPASVVSLALTALHVELYLDVIQPDRFGSVLVAEIWLPERDMVLVALAVGLLLALLAREPVRCARSSACLWCLTAAGTLGCLWLDHSFPERARAKLRARGWPAALPELYPAIAGPDRAACDELSLALIAEHRCIGGAGSEGTNPLDQVAIEGRPLEHIETEPWPDDRGDATLTASRAIQLAGACPFLGRDPGALAKGTLPPDERALDRMLGSWTRLRVERFVRESLFAVEGEPQECEAILAVAGWMQASAGTVMQSMFASAAEKYAAGCFAADLTLWQEPLDPSARASLERAASSDLEVVERAVKGELLFVLDACQEDLVAVHQGRAEVRATLGQSPEPLWRSLEPYSRLGRRRDCASVLETAMVWLDWLAKLPHGPGAQPLWASAPPQDLPHRDTYRFTVAKALAARAIERAALVADEVLRAAGSVPEHLPPDPFRDAPMRARCEPDGRLRVWSVGPDGRDHGGRLEPLSRRSREKKPTDIGLLIADLCPPPVGSASPATPAP